VATGQGMATVDAPDLAGNLRVLPVRTWVKPSRPILDDAETISIWFYPSESRDKLTIREGFWAHRIVKSYRWAWSRITGESAPMEQGTAGDGSPMRVQAPHGPTADRQIIEPQAGFLGGMSRIGSNLPWHQKASEPAAAPAAGK
jgi:hypothetical protein